MESLYSPMFLGMVVSFFLGVGLLFFSDTCFAKASAVQYVTATYLEGQFFSDLREANYQEIRKLVKWGSLTRKIGLSFMILEIVFALLLAPH